MKIWGICVLTIHFSDLSAKSPDVLSIDFCVFGLVKCVLHKRIYNPSWTWESRSSWMGSNTISNITKGIIVTEITL